MDSTPSPNPTADKLAETLLIKAITATPTPVPESIVAVAPATKPSTAPPAPPAVEPPPAPTPPRPITEDDMRFVNWSLQTYSHAEAMGQARLYNFLMADSFLMLSWAAIFAAGPTTPGRPVAMTALSALSLILSVAWFFLGTRQEKILRLQTKIFEAAIARHPDIKAFMCKGTDLQQGKEVEGIRLHPIERWSAERNLGILAPAAIAIASAVLLCLSFQ